MIKINTIKNKLKNYIKTNEIMPRFTQTPWGLDKATKTRIHKKLSSITRYMKEDALNTETKWIDWLAMSVKKLTVIYNVAPEYHNEMKNVLNLLLNRQAVNVNYSSIKVKPLRDMFKPALRHTLQNKLIYVKKIIIETKSSVLISLLLRQSMLV